MARESLNTPYLLLSGVIIIAILVGFTVFRPLFAAARSTQGEVASAGRTLVERQQFLASIEHKKSDLTQQQAEEKQLAVVLPAEDAMDDVARIFHRAANTAGTVLINITNQSDTEKNRSRALAARNQATDLPTQVIPMSIKVQFRGAYTQVRVFLEQLEKSPRLMDVTKVQLRRDGALPDQINADIEVRFYRHEEVDSNG